MRDDQVFDILYFPTGSYHIELIVDHFVEVWKNLSFNPSFLMRVIPALIKED